MTRVAGSGLSVPDACADGLAFPLTYTYSHVAMQQRSSLDRIFRALADGTRRSMIARAEETRRAPVGDLDATMRTRRGGPWEYLLVGMHESDPLLAVVRRYPAVWYTVHVYLACWEDGDRLRHELDGRPMYLELGSL